LVIRSQNIFLSFIILKSPKIILNFVGKWHLQEIGYSSKHANKVFNQEKKIVKVSKINRVRFGKSIRIISKEKFGGKKESVRNKKD